MFQKILVAMDHSPMAVLLFDAALSLAKANQAELMLLHVLSGEAEGSPLPIPVNADQVFWASGSEMNLELWKQQWDAYETEGLAILRSRAVEANQLGVNTEFRQIPGSAGRTICRLAQAWEADLILLGNRGRTGIKELVLGSVSNYVLHHASCSVLTLKEKRS